MPIELVKIYSRPEIRENREKIYIFGDNLARVGYGGQAQAARDEPNAVGIATKINPGEFLRDEFYAEVLVREFLPKFTLLRTHLEAGGTIVWPEDDIGTGLADLPNQAPRIWAKLQELKEWLFNGMVCNKTHPDGEIPSIIEDETESRRDSSGDGGQETPSAV